VRGADVNNCHVVVIPAGSLLHGAQHVSCIIMHMVGACTCRAGKGAAAAALMAAVLAVSSTCSSRLAVAVLAVSSTCSSSTCSSNQQFCQDRRDDAGITVM